MEACSSTVGGWGADGTHAGQVDSSAMACDVPPRACGARTRTCVDADMMMTTTTMMMMMSCARAL